MGMDARKADNRGIDELELEAQMEEILEDQLLSLEKKVRTQLEEKALTWVEEECKKRLATLQETIRQQIQKEVETWIEGELKRRMQEFKRRNQEI